MVHDRRDILTGLFLAIAAGLASYQGAMLVDPILLQDLRAWDTWFQSDTPRVYANMTDRWSDHHRTSVHPLFSLITCPPVYGLRRVLGIETVTAVRIIVATVASLWVVTMFAVLRLMGCRLLDAILFSLLAATSAAALFWFIVPESWGLGSLSILLALLLVALSEHRTPSSWLYLMVSALTLAVTITNWMAGIFATFMRYPWKGSLQISFAALGLVTALWGIEKLVFPSARFFVGHFDSEAPFLLTQLSAGSLNVINAFAFHSMIMPAINVGFLTCYPNAEERVMLTQLSLPGSGTTLGLIAVVIWLALLALGMWALLSVSRHRSLRMALGLTLLGQLVLHLLYGEETFLYSLHFTPLLVLLAALSTLTPVRVVVLVLASVLVLCGGINNGLQLSKALQVFPQHAAGEHPEFPTYEHHGGWIFEAQACRFTATVRL